MSRRHALVIAVATVSIIACRGIVGIEDQSVEALSEAGVGAGGDASLDGSSTDAKTDAPVDAGPPPVDPQSCKNTTASAAACQSCCQSSFQAGVNVLANIAKTDKCVCGAGAACTSSVQCGGLADLCGTDTLLSSACKTCLAGTFSNGGLSDPCKSARDDCLLDLSCKPAYQCFAACKQ